jgi:hypothetical protein
MRHLAVRDLDWPAGGPLSWDTLRLVVMLGQQVLYRRKYTLAIRRLPQYKKYCEICVLQVRCKI